MDWEPHYAWWAREVGKAITPAPEPTPQPIPQPGSSPWGMEKVRNRVQRQLDKIQRGAWATKWQFTVTGEAAKELQAAQELLAEVPDVLKEARG
jgi:hypothetical protein